MKKLLVIFLIFLLAVPAFAQWPYDNKPMLGEQINWANSLSKGLVGLWLFNEDTGSKVFDLSGNGNTGTVTSGLSWGSGKFGSMLESIGGDTPVTVIDNPILRITGPMTVVCWIRIDVLSPPVDWNGIITRWNTGEDDRCWMIIIPAASSGNYVSDTVNFIVSPDGVLNADYAVSINPAHITEGKYHQIIARYDGVTIKIYLDGVEEDSLNYALGLYGDPEPVRFFQHETSVVTLDGAIDHVMIFNRALSASEIAQLYQEPFYIFGWDDIALTEAGIPAPAVGGQVIIIQMGAISILALILIRRNGNQTI